MVALGMMGIAIYYQYVLGEQPCQVCIHARLWVTTIILISITMSFLTKKRLLNINGNLAVLCAATGLAERAFFLYKLENGRGDGSCKFELGMPVWFSVDRWFPSLFEVRNLCSFTPETLAGFSMAESLLIASGAMCLICTMACLLALRTTGS